MKILLFKTQLQDRSISPQLLIRAVMAVNVRANREGCLLISLVSYLICFIFSEFPSHAADTMTRNDKLRENQTLVSAGGVFELGFFTDQSTGNHFLGIWFKDDLNKKAVWVAVRENPILDSSGVLYIRDDGNLVLTDRRQAAMIVNSGMLATRGNTAATLLDSGNLILRTENETIWQSFDYPTDTFIPGMKLGRFGLSSDQPRLQLLVSWVSPHNPTRGLFTLYANSSVLGVWRSSDVNMEIGSWDGNNFQFIFQNSSNNFNFSFVSDANDDYLTFSNRDANVLSWLVISSSGNLDEYSMSDGKISVVSHRLCQGSGNSSWCLSSMPQCDDGEAFSEINGLLLSTMTESISMNFTDCGTICRSNCSCTAFTSEIQDGQTRCLLYYGSRNDLLGIIEKGPGTIYIRGGHGMS